MIIKQKLLYFLVFFLGLSLNLAYSQQTFKITNTVNYLGNHSESTSEVTYFPSKRKVMSKNTDLKVSKLLDEISEKFGVGKSDPIRWSDELELTKVSYEQDLYTETYTPTAKAIMDAKPGHLFTVYKFSYDKKGGRPVMIIMISKQLSFDEIIVDYLYTDYYYELKAKR